MFPISYSIGRSMVAMALGVSLPVVVVAQAPTPAEEARAAMRAELKNREGWQQVYAAEWLLEAGTEDDRLLVQKTMEALNAQGPLSGTEQVGRWRVAALASKDDGRAVLIANLERMAVQDGEPRRLHAVETLAKLGEISPGVAKSTLEWIRSGPQEAYAPFGWWAVAIGCEAERSEARAALISQLRAELPVVRYRAAYALGQLGQEGGVLHRSAKEIAAALRAKLREEAGAGEQAVYQVQWALYLTSADVSEREALRASLLEVMMTTPGVARLMAATFADTLTEAELEVLQPRLLALLRGDDFHLRWAAARLLVGCKRS